VTFTATVTDEGGGGVTPTGSVAFTDTSTGAFLGYGILKSAGTGVATASLTTTSLTAGTNQDIVGAYSGSADMGSTPGFAPESSPPAVLTVNVVGTAASITSVNPSPSSTTYGSTVTLNATVTHGTMATSAVVSSGGTGYNVGDILTVLGGAFAAPAQLEVTNTGAGGVVTAVSVLIGEAGDYSTTPTNPVSVTDTNTAGSPTATGARFTLSYSTNSGTPHGGSVTFMDTFNGNTVILGYATVNAAGVASLTVPSSGLVPFAVGTHSLTASYSGDATFNTSPVSTTKTETVSLATPTTTVTSSAPAGSVYGQAVTFSASVNAAPATSAPTGTVVFTNKTTGAVLGTVTLTASDNGVVSLPANSKLPVGTTGVSATYTPDATSGAFLKASLASTTFTQTVNKDSAFVGVSRPSTTNANQPISLTVNVSAASPGSGTPTGTATVYVDGAAMSTVALNSIGQAVFNIGGQKAGMHTIYVMYNGDGNFLTTSSAKQSYYFVNGRVT